MRSTVPVLLILAACHSPGDDLADLGAPADDLAVGDLADADATMPTDLADSFCAQLNTALAGGTPTNCAVAYMRDMVRCFNPSDHCRYEPKDGSAGDLYCWDDGTSASYMMLTGVVTMSAAKNGQLCGSYSGIDLFLYANLCLPSAGPCDGRPDLGIPAGANAYVSLNEFICPDGTRVPLPDSPGPAKQCGFQLLAPPQHCDGQGSVLSCDLP